MTSITQAVQDQHVGEQKLQFLWNQASTRSLGIYSCPPPHQRCGFAAMLLPLPAMLRLLTHALCPFCGLNTQSVGFKTGLENSELLYDFLNENILFMCTCIP